MTTPDNFLAFAYPDAGLNGPITDVDGRTKYTLTSKDRTFGSDTTTISRPDASTVAVIKWGSVVELKRRSVVLANVRISIPVKEFLVNGKTHSSGGPDSQSFQDQEGKVYYWKNDEVSRPVLHHQNCR